MPARINIIGHKFTRVLVLRQTDPIIRKNGKPRRCCVCLCDCGTEFITKNEDLLSGNTKSCGCLHSDLITQRSTKHGHAKRGHMTRTYASWREMMSRCTNPNLPCADNYVNRGIGVCNGLRNYPRFLTLLGECPEGQEIDRWPNNNGSYTCGQCAECIEKGWPLNVRWATAKQQARNKRNNRIFTINGITACLAELCELYHVRYGRVMGRLRLGWSIENALVTPKLGNQFTRR